MRIVVVGATGNVGTAVVRRLAAERASVEIVGVARRLPDLRAEPYGSADGARVPGSGPLRG